MVSFAFLLLFSLFGETSKNCFNERKTAWSAPQQEVTSPGRGQQQQGMQIVCCLLFNVSVCVLVLRLCTSQWHRPKLGNLARSPHILLASSLSFFLSFSGSAAAVARQPEPVCGTRQPPDPHRKPNGPRRCRSATLGAALTRNRCAFFRRVPLFLASALISLRCGTTPTE
jgi:hypothetical protein